MCTRNASGETHLPNYSSDLTASMDEILAQASFEGLEKRVGQLETNYQDRLNFELKIIIRWALKYFDCGRFYSMGKNHQVPVLTRVWGRIYGRLCFGYHRFRSNCAWTAV